MRSLVAFLLSFYCFTLLGQKFETDTIAYTGSSIDRINLVYLSEGYTEEQLDRFITDVFEFNDKLFSEIPFSNYVDYFNVFAIRVPSNEEGADHPGTATDVTEPRFPVSSVDTYFNSEFDYLKIHRLLVARNSAAVNSVLAVNFPMYDQAFIIVNSPHYGGSGGAIPVSSTDESAAEIVIHELGHSFARLSDEYYAGDIFAKESANMTQIDDPEIVKWKNWNNTDGVGVYQHCCNGQSSSWYKPHENCKMRVLGAPFCPVCRETIIERIHSFISPIEDYSPKEEILSPDSFPLTFDIKTIEPIPNTLSNSWKLNDELIATNKNTIELESQMLENDVNRLVMILEDTTDMLRVNDHSSLHAELLIWEIDNITTPTINVNSERIRLDIFPNPVSKTLNITTQARLNSNINFEIYNIDGKQVSPSFKAKLNESISKDVSHLSVGLYIISIRFENGSQYSERIMIR